VGNIGEDVTLAEMHRQHADALRIIAELRERAERAERKAARWKELYESSLAIVRCYQAERESLLARVQAALLGIASASDSD